MSQVVGVQSFCFIYEANVQDRGVRISICTYGLLSNGGLRLGSSALALVAKRPVLIDVGWLPRKPRRLLFLERAGRGKQVVAQSEVCGGAGQNEKR